MTHDASHIAAEFPRQSEDDWRALAEASLKGEALESLTRKTEDGIIRGPVFFRGDRPEDAAIGAPGHAPYTRGASAVRDPFLPWDIRSPIPGGAPESVSKTALAALQGGASSLTFRLGQGGIAAQNLNQLKDSLKGVKPDLAGLWLFDAALPAAALLAAFWEENGAQASDVKGGFGLSPISLGALTGGAAAGWETGLADLLSWQSDQGFDIKSVAIRGDIACEAGGSPALEIAFMAAEAAEYFRGMIGAGAAPELIARGMEIRLAADSDVHENIAKIRAARRVWTQIATAFGAGDIAPHIHAITARRMMSATDSWTNLLRLTASAFAAAAGGADAITVRPLTEAAGYPSDFALRLSKNIQIMLAEESHIGHVQDPAGGAFLHEHLSAEIARDGWKTFQHIEEAGGLSAALKSGWIQKEISKTRNARIKSYENGEILLGVNKYPSEFDEPETGDSGAVSDPPEGDSIPETGWKAALEAAKTGAKLPEITPKTGDFEPLKPIRWAEAFNG